MILSFKRRTPWHTDTNFKLKIQSRSKIHTFRMSKQMQPGHVIEFWEENPRNTTLNPEPFELPSYDCATEWKQIEDKEGRMIEKPVCFAIEPFRLVFPQLQRNKSIKKPPKNIKAQLQIADLWINEQLLQLVAYNDGFDNSRDFLMWFMFNALKKKTHILTGEIKHWTDQVYDAERAKTINDV